MHPWHDIPVDETRLETSFPAVIEISRGDKNKYELDKETGMLKLDRVLHGAVHYPANYGFIPRTFCEDDDPLDVLVLCQEPVYPLTLVEARAIAAMRMEDEKGTDDKIIAVAVHDPSVSQFYHHTELPNYLLGEIRKFFAEYKTLERKEVLVEDLQDRDKALEILRQALRRYRRLDLRPAP